MLSNCYLLVLVSAFTVSSVVADKELNPFGKDGESRGPEVKPHAPAASRPVINPYPKTDENGKAPISVDGASTLLPIQGPGPQLPPWSNGPYREMGFDPTMMDGFDLTKFLCSTCRSLVDVGKHLIEHNYNKHMPMDNFFENQHYFTELKESCKREFDASNARVGKYFACETVLLPHLQEIQQKIRERGIELVKEKNELCFDQGLRLCKLGLLSSITGK
ncbi:hypothetical protein M3Y94_00713300 [Aphelenchoides besseyi]|nr:hypothetical protein M3Y94_00713300 [Aphelenchoides besseyi]KAI6231731.1 hypothetical protein M3Y95_00412700 [Aphelenchoides besseyi]